MIRITIIDDHPIVQEGLKNLLNGQPNFQVLKCYDSGNSAMEGLKSEQVDMILLDINLPDVSGLDLCKKIKSNFPEIGIIALSTHNERAMIMSMLENGARGYVLKNSVGDEIVNAIHNVYDGNKYFCQATRLVIDNAPTEDLDKVPLITRREKEVLQLISKGNTTHQIAENLFISVHTVESHRKKLIEKFNANNITSVVRLAAEYNLL